VVSWIGASWIGVINELLRRASQYYLEDDSGKQLTIDNIQDALDEILFQGGQLNLKLLGGDTSTK